MKILHVISSVDPAGGGPIEGIKQRGAWLVEHGHQVEVLCLDDPTEPFVRDFPLPVHAVGPSWGTYRANFKTQDWLLRHAARYDHVVVSGLWQSHGWATMRAMRKLGRPYHVFAHGMLDPWFRHTYPLKHLKKWLYWLPAEYHVLRRARKVFFTSEEERLRSRESFALYQANEQVVPYGTRPPPVNKAELAQAFLQEHPELAGKHLLLYLSRIHEKKGCDLLIQALSEVVLTHPDVHLLMAGNGASSAVSALKTLAATLGVAEHITWLGMVQGKAKWQAFHASRAFVLPSHQENFGIAVAEALGCGLPVLISDKVNIWREVQADHAGIVGADDPEGTLTNLNAWLSLSPQEQSTMGIAAQTCFRHRYSVEAMGQGLLDALAGTPHDQPPKSR